MQNQLMNVIVSLLKSIIEFKIFEISLKIVLNKKSLMMGGMAPCPLDPPLSRFYPLNLQHFCVIKDYTAKRKTLHAVVSNSTTRCVCFISI